jgi:hypothetical protein
MKRTGVLLFTLFTLCALGAGTAAAAETGLPNIPTYRKPFLSGGRAAVGGYMDLEFLAGDEGSTFDQHRFVPFIYAAVSDRVHVASEIEFEHGGFVSGEDETGGEIKLEFAHVDFTVNEGLNVRGGVILSPLGRLNVLHDAPMLDLTDRPLVNRFVIPTTLSESGLGVFGVIYPNEAWVVDYEAYLVNGFGDATVTGAGTLNLRGGRGSQSEDNNNARAVVGRLGVSPRLGTEFGASLHTGSYDAGGDQNLTLAALDARFAQGPVEILAEGALARADLPDSLLAGDAARSAGFYLEGRVHLLAGAVTALPQSVFTAVVRADYVDRDRETDGSDVERLTLGLNFRPTEQTVFKNDVLFDRSRSSGETDWSDTETAYRFSIATYF